MNISQPFSIVVPAKSLSNLKRYLKTHYSIELKQRRTKQEFLIIK